MKHFQTLSDMHRANGFPLPENPMINLIHCKGTCSITEREFTSDFYMIGFKKLKSGVFMYGRTKYDHDHGSMSFVKPRQVIQMQNLEFEEDGFLILFHEDFLTGHNLHTDIKNYGYFDYEANEALYLSPREEEIIWELFRKIDMEIYNNQDEYSREIMLAHVDSILKYAQRFYKRQFIHRQQVSGKTISKFDYALKEYFKNGSLYTNGLPSVQLLADKLNISPRYLSDMLKQESGKTALELIHIYTISEAKNLLKVADQSVAEIAYTLGFENPPYFSRLFKKEVGISPNEFKKQRLN